MPMTAADVMQSRVDTVTSTLPLPDLERAMVDRRVHGFPVVDQGRLVGIVTRSDVIRTLCVEQSLAETVTDFYQVATGITGDIDEDLEAIATRVGKRIEKLKVSDVMSRSIISVAPDTPIEEVAKKLVDHEIHRILVTEGGTLHGLIASQDLVALLADGRARVD